MALRGGGLVHSAPFYPMSFSRRRFLTSSVATLAVLPLARLQAIESFNRQGAPRMRLGLAAYTFRDFFKINTRSQKPSEDRKLDMKWFISYCAEQGCDGAELTSYFFANDVSDTELQETRRHAFLNGVSVSGTSVGNNFAIAKGPELDAQIADVKKWIDRAAMLGAPHIRVFAGQPPKGTLTVEEARKNCIEALEECCAYAGTKGIFLGLENHLGIVTKPEELLSIVRDVKSPWFGINLDTGNFHTEDPYAAMAMCAPYAVNVQIKTEIQLGLKAPKVPGDIPRMIQILRDANYRGWVTLEYEGKEEPFKAVPVYLAQLKELIGGAAPAKPATEEGWTPIFDGKTLDGWKRANFAGGGDIGVENGNLMIDMGSELSGANYTKPTPKMDYEIALEAMKLDGDDFFVGLTFPVGESHVTFVSGGWAGTIVGISSIDGNDASENETTSFQKFDKNRWYAFRIRVKKDRLDVWIDNKPVVELDTKGKKLSMRSGEIEESLPFGLATFRTRSAVRNIRLREIPAN